jgi:hypothetical protein
LVEDPLVILNLIESTSVDIDDSGRLFGSFKVDRVAGVLYETPMLGEHSLDWALPSTKLPSSSSVLSSLIRD